MVVQSGSAFSGPVPGRLRLSPLSRQRWSEGPPSWAGRAPSRAGVGTVISELLTMVLCCSISIPFMDAVFGDLVLLAVGLDQWPRRLARWRRLSDRTRSRFGRGRPFSPAISRRNVWPRKARPLSASRSNYPQLDENAPLVEVELSARGYLTITSRGAALLGRATDATLSKAPKSGWSPRPRDRHR